MQNNVTNIFHTDNYKEKWNKINSLFAQDTHFEYENMSSLLGGYTLKKHIYSRDYKNNQVRLTENFLFDPYGKLLYKYRSIDDGNFATIIKHSNEGLYFIFRIELYGYGILEVKTGKKFIYIPSEPETFVWCEANYNPSNNFMVVNGYYWAAPNGVILVDFRNPMNETRWIDIRYCLGDKYDSYEDIDFVRWDDDTLVLSAYQYLTQSNVTLTIPKSVYLK